MGILGGLFDSETEVKSSPWGPTHQFYKGGTYGGTRTPIYGEAGGSKGLQLSGRGIGGGGGPQIIGYDTTEGQEIPGVLPESARIYDENLEAGPVGFDPYQQQGLDMLAQYAQGGQLGGLLGDAFGGTQFLASGDVLSPDSNPYLSQVADAYAQNVGENLNRNVLSDIDDSFIGAGQGWNSSRQGIERGLAMGEAADAIAQNTARLYSDAYGQGLTAMQGGLSLTPNIGQFGQMPGGLLADVGGQFQGQSQYEQGYPWEQLSNYGNIINAAAGKGGSQVTTGSPSTAQQIGMLGQFGAGMYGAFQNPAMIAATPGGSVNPLMAGGY